MLYEEETAYYLSSWLCIVSVRSFLGDSAWCRAGQKTKLPAVLSALQDLLGVLEQQEVKALGTSQAGLKIQPWAQALFAFPDMSAYSYRDFWGDTLGRNAEEVPDTGSAV